MADTPPRTLWDLAPLMRTRLLCGLYNRRAVPPRWRRLAKAYCIILLATITSYTLYLVITVQWQFLLVWMPNLILYVFNVLVALCTEDEFIYNFFTQNTMTDATLDSSAIFDTVQKQIRRKIFVLLFITCIFGANRSVISYQLGLSTMFIHVIPLMVLEVFLVSVNLTKSLIMALFESRLLVLKRRLQRYGFRNAGGARRQPYCDIYHQIIQGLDDTSNPLKLLLWVDLICCCIKIIMAGLSASNQLQYAVLKVEVYWAIALHILRGVKILFESFDHVALLESAAQHCDDMAVFTVTELIKTPTAEQQGDMLLFLDTLEQRGARYQLLSALPLDWRFALRVLTFCSAQIMVFINSVSRP